MSMLRYNNVPLPYLLTKSIDFNPVYTDDQVDYLYTHVVLNVQSMIHGWQSPGAQSLSSGSAFASDPNPLVGQTALTPAFAGESATSTMKRIEHALNRPRRELLFTNGSDTLLQIKPGECVRGGPYPRGLSIIQIGSTESYLVQFRIEAYIRQCPGLEEGQHPLYLSNRWREQVTINDEFLTTKIRTGKIITRHGINPDTLRGVVCPPIDPKFMRQSSDYTLSEDGFSLYYVFIDKEAIKRPPEEAIKADGNYLETQNQGESRWGEVRLTLTGHRYAEKPALVRSATAIAIQRLRRGGLAETDQGIAAVVTLGENLFSNQITLSMRAMMYPYKLVKSAASGTPIDEASDDLLEKSLKAFKNQDYTSAIQPPDPGTRASGKLTLIAAALNDPCLARTANEMAQQESAIAPVGNPSLTTGSSVSPSSAQLSSDAPPSQQTGGSDQPTNVAVGVGGIAGLATMGGTATANVTFSSAQLPDEADANADPYLTGGVYTDYQLNMVYEGDEHVGMLTLMGRDKVSGGDTAEFCYLGEPTLTLRVEWTTERLGASPEIPPRESKDPNAVLMKWKVCPSEIKFAPGGRQRIARVSGIYQYGFRNPRKVNLAAGVPPWVLDLEASGSPTGTGSLGSAASAIQEEAKGIATNTREGIIDLAAKTDQTETSGNG